jgi:polygalacturonase
MSAATRHGIPLLIALGIGWFSHTLALAGEVDRMFNVREFGAVGDGRAKDTAAIQKAVDACHRAGGGTVRVPAGVYLTGTIYLKSNVELSLASGSVLLGSPNKEDYNADDFCPQNRFSTKERSGGAHLITAVEQENVAISGQGRIDGNSSAFFTVTDGKASWKWRPGQMVFFCECRNVTIRGPELDNATYWTCFLHGCEEVIVDGVRIKNPVYTPNGDGIDIDSCRNVVVSNAIIESGDDCITLRGNTEPLKQKRPCENVTIANCVLKTPCNAVRVGVGDHVIRNCVFTNLAIRETRTAFNFYSNWRATSRGTTIENIRIHNCTLDVSVPFFMTLGHPGENTRIRNIYVHGVSGTAGAESVLAGAKDNRLTNLSFSDVHLTFPKAASGEGAMAFTNIDGLELVHVKMIEAEPPADARGRTITLQNVDHLTADHCWPEPAREAKPVPARLGY